jgi:hypothetical protein
MLEHADWYTVAYVSEKQIASTISVLQYTRISLAASYTTQTPKTKHVATQMCIKKAF